jgi:hypothetical protein
MLGYEAAILCAPAGADQMKKARLIKPNLPPPALGDATCSSRLSKSNFCSSQEMGTIGVSRKPQASPERGGNLAAEDRAVDAITLKSETVRNLLRNDGKAEFSLHR